METAVADADFAAVSAALASYHTDTYMQAGARPAMVESLGDYFAAADIAGAPVPPPGVISRAVALQGATCALAGMWGTSSGTAAYNEVKLRNFGIFPHQFS